MSEKETPLGPPGEGEPAEKSGGPERTIIDDIIEQGLAGQAEAAAPADSPAQEDPPGREENPPPPPSKNKPSSVYLYLLVMFGAAFLMLLLAYFVQQRNSDAVQDDLELLTASRQELLEQIKGLEEENVQLQADLNREKTQGGKTEEENQNLKEYLASIQTQLTKENNKALAASYLWYVDQFMRDRDYPMAAAAIVFSADPYHGKYERNPAQNQQYQSYRQELIDRGYLQQLDHPQDGGTDIYFTDRWNPSQNVDAAKLSILWCVLEAYFVQEYGQAASQYLSNTVLAFPDTDLKQAGSFALEQLQNAKDGLVESKWLTVDGDGILHEGFGPDGAKADILYNLPFELPAQMILLPIKE